MCRTSRGRGSTASSSATPRTASTAHRHGALGTTGANTPPLLAPSTTIVRSRAEQLPADPIGQAILAKVRETFRGREHDFERCAVELWRLIAPATGRCDITQPSRDGGRDAIGEYVLGPAADPITIDFALEAKCYDNSTSVGVHEVARLISRLRHRHFGVFVTTSHFNQEVYSEVRSDGHPICTHRWPRHRPSTARRRPHGRAVSDCVAASVQYGNPRLTAELAAICPEPSPYLNDPWAG